MLTYMRNVMDGVMTTVKGMQITLRNLGRPETTVEYPEELMPLPEGYRGVHTLDTDICIYCFQCAKICPVDCIEMKAERVDKKFLSWEVFTVDYNKCLFCDLCIEVCPKDCIHMDKRDGSAKFALITDDRSTLNLSLLEYTGLSEADKKAREKLQAAAAAKEEAGADGEEAPKKAALPGIPGKKAPAIPGKAAPAVPGKTPAIPGKTPAVPGKTPAIPGKSKTPPVPGKGAAVPGKKANVPGANIPGKGANIPGKKKD